jgi:S-formylglutathione hydrolase FrmB
MRPLRTLGFLCLSAARPCVFVAICAFSLLDIRGTPVRGLGASPPLSPEPRTSAGGASTTECGSIQSAILARSVEYCADVPAGYASSSKRYPTLYFLHGLFENEQSWIERGGREILDKARAQGQVGDFLVILPDGGKTFYVNSFDGHDRYEDFFIQELVPAIDRKYRTLPDRGDRGVSGSSMGGYGALHLAMRHSDVFGSVAAQSAALVPMIPDPLPSDGRWSFYAHVLAGPFGAPLNGSYWEANSPIRLAEHPERFAGLKLYFDCGDKDRYGFEEGAELLDRILAEKHFPHEFLLRSGNHGWSYLNQYMKYALLFEWRAFEQGGRGGPSSAGPAGLRMKQPQPRRGVAENDRGGS